MCEGTKIIPQGLRITTPRVVDVIVRPQGDNEEMLIIDQGGNLVFIHNAQQADKLCEAIAIISGEVFKDTPND